MKHRSTAMTVIVFSVLVLVTSSTRAVAAQIGPSQFEDPLVFDFSELDGGTHLGSGYANPYANAGVEFTGYIADYDYEDISGRHLASGFANSPAEPYVVRLRLLDDFAAKVGAYVWAGGSGDTWITAYDQDGLVIDTLAVDGYTCSFVGFESTVGRPISVVEWRGPTSSSFTTFPRVDNVMMEYVPEPATLSLLALGGLGALTRRRRG